MRFPKLHAAVLLSTFRTLQPGALLEVELLKKCTAVTQSTCGSQNVKNTSGSEHFWQLSRWAACGCSAKHISKSKCPKQCMFRALLEVCCSKSDRDCGAKWMSKSKCQNTTSSEFFYTFNRPTVIFHGNRNGCCKKWAKREGFVAVSKTLAGVDLQRCILLGRGNTRDASVRHVRKSGRWFPWKGCILECRIFRFAKTILRDRHRTSHDLVSLFQGHAQYFGEMGWKITKRTGSGPSALHGRISFAPQGRFLSEVSQNCLVLIFWGSLAKFCRLELWTSTRIQLLPVR